MALMETVVDEKFIAEMEQYRTPKKDVGLIEQCSNSVVLFAERMLGVKLRAWQIYVLHNMQLILEGKPPLGCDGIVREGVILTSRQIGKTTLNALFDVWVIVFNKKPSGLEYNSPVGIISASDDQAKKLLEMMKKLLIMGDKFMARTYKTPEGKPLFGTDLLQNCIDKKGANNTDTMTFCKYDEKTHGPFILKGSVIGTTAKSLPPTTAILGNTFAVATVDEAGKTEKVPDNVLLDYLSPATDEFGAPTFYTSTAWEPSGIFYEKCDVDDNHPNPSVWRCLFTIEAIKIESPKRYAETMKKIDAMNAEGKTAEVQRAYYCKFIKGEKNYFDPDKVKTCFTESYKSFEGYSESCDMGVDFGGQVKSRTVITISSMNENGEVRRLYHKAYEVGQDDSLMDDIEDLKKRFNIERIIPDDCPAGHFLIRKMIEKGWNVLPMNFRTDKVKKYGAFRAKHWRGKIISYLDQDLKTEMLALQQSETAKQSLIEAASGYRDDLIDSWVMSCYFFVEEEDEFNFYDFKEFSEEYDKEEAKKIGSVHDKKEREETRTFRSIRF